MRYGTGGIRTLMSTVAIASLSVGCASIPREGDVVAESDSVRARVMELAQEVVARVEHDDGAQGVSVFHSPEVEDRWAQCTDVPVADSEVPELIQWSSRWTVTFEPRRDTASLLDDVAAPYLADGWTAGPELTPDGGRSLPLSRDGYTLRLGGVTGVDEQYAASVVVRVTGPCIKAPQDIREWRPEPSTSATTR